MPSTKRDDARALREIRNRKKVEITKLQLQRAIREMLRQRRQQILYKDVSALTDRSTNMISHLFGTLENLIVQSVMPYYDKLRVDVMRFNRDHAPEENVRHYVEALFADEQLCIMTAAYYHDTAFVNAGTKGLRNLISEGLVFTLGDFEKRNDAQQVADFFVDAIMASVVLHSRVSAELVEFTIDQVMHYATAKASVAS